MRYSNPAQIQSSYRRNDLGKTLYDTVIELQPKSILEFGAFHGYSTICMAMALEDLGCGKIYSYDNWVDSVAGHADMTDAQYNVHQYRLDHYVEFHRANFYGWSPERQYDIAHIDLNNTGEIINAAYEKLKDHVKVIIFEGGSVERDGVSWMVAGEHLPIRNCGVEYVILNPNFPSISRIL